MGKIITTIIILIISSFLLFNTFINSWFGMQRSALLSTTSQQYKKFASEYNLIPTDQKFMKKNIEENFEFFYENHRHHINSIQSIFLTQLLINFLLIILLIALIRSELEKSIEKKYKTKSLFPLPKKNKM